MKYFASLFAFLRDIFLNKGLIWQMTKRDFRQRYLGSYLGILWAFIQPVITVFIFWFVFEVGFKSMPVEGFPFILWLICGMFPWFFFADSVSGAAGSILENSFLVKKIVFRVELLPIVKIMSALVVHMFFVVIMFLLFAVYGYEFDLYNLQIFYYLFAIICLVTALSWMVSALTVFLRDVGQFVGMGLQFLFWGTPIFWSLNMLPEKYRLLMKLNPVYYIVEGYRDAFINKMWFWEHAHITPYFWLTTVVMLLIGVFIFKRLRPHFADVL